jgi:hypothetical protein
MNCGSDPMTPAHPLVTPPWTHAGSSGPTADLKSEYLYGSRRIQRFSAVAFPAGMAIVTGLS